jgi:cytochrome c oxidase cbb3-type subunit IV
MQGFMTFLGSLWVVWAVALFIGIVVWAFWPKNRSRFEADSKIPLRDDREER